MSFLAFAINTQDGSAEELQSEFNKYNMGLFLSIDQAMSLLSVRSRYIVDVLGIYAIGADGKRVTKEDVTEAHAQPSRRCSRAACCGHLMRAWTRLCTRRGGTRW